MSIKVTVMSLDLNEQGSSGHLGPSTQVFDKNEITMGSDPSSDLVLNHPGIDAKHVSLRVGLNKDTMEPTLFVRDLGSSNGTFVEENSLRSQIEVEMLPNERIIIGEYLIKPLFESKKPIVKAQKTFNPALSAPTSHKKMENPANQIRIALSGRHLEHIDFEATELFRVRGRIIYKGKPLKQVTVDGGQLGKVVTGIDGEFEFSDIPEGTKCSLFINRSGFIFDSSELEQRIDSDIELNITATQLFTIAGTVLHLGAPLQKVEIDAGSLGTYTTDDYGRFLIRDVPEFTKYDLKPRKNKFIFSTPGSRGSLDGEPVSLLFTARELFSISGRVMHHGKPMPGVRVVAEGLGEMISNSEGRYLFQNVPEGKSYTLRIHKNRYAFRRKI